MNQLTPPQIISDFSQSRIFRGRMQTAIIAGVFLISIALAMLASNTLILALLIIIAVVGGLLVVTLNQSLGILLVLMSAFSIPNLGDQGGFNATVVGVTGLSLLWFADMFIRQRRIHLVRSSMNLPIIVFLASSFISFMLGQIPWYPTMRQAPITAQIGGFAIFAMSAFCFLLVANVVKTPGWLKVFIWFFVFMSTLYSIGRLIPFAGQYLRFIFQDGMTTGSVFWVWMFVIPYSQALLNTKLRKSVRAALFLLLICLLYFALIQARAWKSGYIPPLAGIGVVTALWLRKKVWYFAPLVPIAIWYISQEALESDQYSAATRFEAWKIVFELSVINPIFGLGFANYYWYTPLIPIGGWYVSFNSHSQYIDIFSQTGVVGLISVAWVFIAFGLLAWKLHDKVEEGFAKAYVYGALGGLVGTFVAGIFVDWILPFVYNIGLTGFRSSMLTWIFMGGLVYYENKYLQHTAATTDPIEPSQRRST